MSSLGFSWLWLARKAELLSRGRRISCCLAVLEVCFLCGFPLSQSVEGEVQNLAPLDPAAESDSSISTSRLGKSVRFGCT